jgi:hypothetical protein
MILVTTLALGCGMGTKEIKPDKGGQPPDPEKVKQGMDESMKHIPGGGGPPGGAS